MIESYEDLASGLGALSNYFDKYLKIIQRHSPALRKRLDEEGMTGKVHLWRKAHNYKRQMAAVVQVARNQHEVRTFLGTYFALQLLHLHFLNIHRLRREASIFKNRMNLFRTILTRVRLQLRTLVSCYLSAIVGVFAEGRSLEGVAICNVGMIMDQDDLDVGIFVRPDVDRQFWNRVISQTSAEFMKYSNKMHFYLAERVADETFLTTLDDYRNYLRRGVHNFVLISELLLTEPLTGDYNLIRQLEEEIIDQFYYDTGNLRLHEGYLRGMIGEVQELLRFELESPWISPKNHGLRLIHSMMSMLKTIHGIHEHGSRDIIDLLQVRDAESADLYENLQGILSFIEMFYYVYQLLVSVEDSFDFNDEVTIRNLDEVAKVLGYHQLGVVRPGMRLLTHYYERIDWLRSIAHKVIDKINNHLKRITVFNQIIAGEKPAGYPLEWTDNVALNILEMFKMYRGMIYWDDILQLLAEQDGHRLESLIRSLDALDEHQRMHTFERLLRLLAFDMDSMVTTAVLFAKYARKLNVKQYVDHLLDWLVRHFETQPLRLCALISQIPIIPATLTEFLFLFKTEQLLALRRMAARLDPARDAPCDLRDKFTILCELLSFSSNNFRSYYLHVARTRPEIVTHVDDLNFLNRVSDQVWAELSDAKTPDELKQKLVVYYECSFCRCGLLAIDAPGNLQGLYGSYHSFFRRYFRWLYRACQWEVESQELFDFNFRDRDEDDQPIAIFCSGGYAREEAFENDIDLCVLVMDDNPDLNDYGSRIINEINRELSRQGVMPHHRIAEFFDSFIIPFHRLDEFLSQPYEHDFIEISQLLSCRLLIGSKSYDHELTSLLHKYLFQNPRRFICNIIDEIRSRARYKIARRDRSVNVKEDPGALRDIQMIVTACQALVGDREPVIWKALQRLMAEIPALSAEFRTLDRSYRFMRFFRDIYSLSLSEEDDIMRDRLISTAHRMGFEEGELTSEVGTAPKLLNSYRYHRRRARRSIGRISDYLLQEERCVSGTPAEKEVPGRSG